MQGERNERERGRVRTRGARDPRSEPLVLLVEDEAPLRELLSEVLGRAGYRVAVVPDGRAVEAWWEDSGERPALLLADLHLPGEGGRSLASRLREQWPGLHVLFMSGQPDDEAQAAGDTFLTKPFRLGELVARVEAALPQPPGN